MPEQNARSSARWEMEMQVIRADGTVDDLGTVASTKWGRFSLSRLGARYRIWRANRRHAGRLRHG